jgi:hypothetical protein
MGMAGLGSISTQSTPDEAATYTDGAIGNANRYYDQQFSTGLGSFLQNGSVTGLGQAITSFAESTIIAASPVNGGVEQSWQNAGSAWGEGRYTASIGNGFMGTLPTALAVAPIIGGEFSMATSSVESSAVGSRAIVPYSGQATATSWPGNAGFLGSATETELPVGTLVDRYGARGGTYVSPVGTPFANRGLPAGHASLPLESYEVVSPFNVKSGPAAPAFGQPGLGTQHELPMSVQELIDLGLLKPR